MFEIQPWNCLDAKYIVAVKNSFKVFKFQEGLLQFVDVFVQIVFFRKIMLFKGFQLLQNVAPCIFGSFLKHVRKDFVEKLVDSVFLQVTVNSHKRWHMFL